MAQIEELRTENQDLRLKLREAELREGALTQALGELRKAAAWHSERLAGVGGRVDLQSVLQNYKFHEEIFIGRALGGFGQVVDAVTRALGCDPKTDVVSLQDLAYVSRAALAAAKGVGPKTMEKLDAAMAEYDLQWADAEAVPV